MERTESVVEERTALSAEVLEKPVRRRFTVQYKARIVAEAVWINPPTPSSENREKRPPKTVGSQKPDAPSAHPRVV